MNKTITLANLAQATEQEVFNQVAVHLLTQKKQSSIEIDGSHATQCLYRSPDGLKCAAGCLIADSEYKKEFDTGEFNSPSGGTAWADLINAKKVPDTHKSLIIALQGVHDNAFIGVDKWYDQLALVAGKFNLTMPTIEA